MDNKAYKCSVKTITHNYGAQKGSVYKAKVKDYAYAMIWFYNTWRKFAWKEFIEHFSIIK